MSNSAHKRFDFSSEKRALLQHLLKQQGVEAPAALKSTQHTTNQTYPLSFAQQRIWFLHQMEPASSAHHMLNAVWLTGSLNTRRLIENLTEIVQRHTVLRSTFPLAHGEPVQQINDGANIHVQQFDLCTLPRESREPEVIATVRRDKQTPFDLVKGPLTRFYLLQVDTEEHVLLISTHHIVFDAWSMGILLQELSVLYTTEGPSPLPPIKIQYVDFATWQRSWLKGDAQQRQRDYWVQRLGDAPVLLTLPTDQQRKARQEYIGHTHTFTISPELTTQLRNLCQREDVTLAMLLLAAFQLLLSRYSGQEDITVGMPVSSRSRVEFESLIGNFVNTIALRNDLQGNPSFQTLLKRVKDQALGAYSNQDIPFEQVVETLHPQRYLSQTVLFQVLFSLQNASKKQNISGLSTRPFEINSEVFYAE